AQPVDGANLVFGELVHRFHCAIVAGFCVFDNDFSKIHCLSSYVFNWFSTLLGTRPCFRASVVQKVFHTFLLSLMQEGYYGFSSSNGIRGFAINHPRMGHECSNLGQ
ncbi:MAG: hypothetical protein ACOY0R_02260, partial [Chloroflexota bacterium]